MLQHRGGTLVAWVDQFNKARYSKTPATGRDISLSTTAMALIPASRLRGHFAGHPTPDSLYSDVAQHVTDLQDAWVSFTASTKHLVCQHMGFEQARCPFDLHHKEVEATPWYPSPIRDVPVSATFGFHRTMYGVLQLANNCSAPVLPMLCNITLYYSYLKMLYSCWMQPLHCAMCTAPFVPCSVSGIHISIVLITHIVLSFHSWWHLNTKGSFKTQRRDNYMHILPLLLRSVLFWLFTSPYQVYVLTYVLLLAVEHLKISS